MHLLRGLSPIQVIGAIVLAPLLAFIATLALLSICFLLPIAEGYRLSFLYLLALAIFATGYFALRTKKAKYQKPNPTIIRPVTHCQDSCKPASETNQNLSQSPVIPNMETAINRKPTANRPNTARTLPITHTPPPTLSGRH